MTRWMLAAIVAGGAAMVVQADPPSTGAMDALAGPRVEIDRSPTLLRRDADGRILRTEGSPEVSALALLDLTPEVAGRVAAVLEQRSRFLESFVMENLELLGRLDTAVNAGDKLDRAILGVQVLAKLTPLAREGSLRKRARALLPAVEAERFEDLLDEYWEAIISQSRRADPGTGRFEVVMRERMESVTREIDAAFERLEKSGELLYRYFFSEVELRKDQEGEIRALLDEYVEDTRGAPTKEQEQRIFFAVMSRLDPGQQTALVKQFRGGVGGKPD